MIRREGILQRSREEDPREKEVPVQSPETEPSSSGSRDQKEVSMAGAGPGRKREVRDQRDRLDWITGGALEDYDTDHPSLSSMSFNNHTFWIVRDSLDFKCYFPLLSRLLLDMACVPKFRFGKDDHCTFGTVS